MKSGNTAIPFRELFFILLILLSGFSKIGASELPALEGRLLLFGKTYHIYNFTNDEHKIIASPHNKFLPEYQCKSHRGDLIIQSTSYIGKPMSVIGKGKLSGRPLYYFNPIDYSFTLIGKIAQHEFTCQRIDYLEETNQYLFSGWFQDQRGVYILDTSFAVVENITPILEKAIGKVKTPRLLYLDKKKLLYWDSHEVYIVNMADTSAHKIVDGFFIEHISPDRHYAILNTKKATAYIINLETKQLQFIEEKAFGMMGAFSPDSKYVMFRWAKDAPNHKDYLLCLYDIEKQKMIKTDIRNQPQNWFRKIMWIE